MNIFRKKSLDKILSDVKANEADAAHGGGGLKRTLTTRDLTSLGIAAIIGAGIFSTIGKASEAGGPAVSMLFLFTALTCGFSALCYAEFASAIPIAGSAYTYAYASLGEILAWLIGWCLVLEYAVSNIAVAISWSGYFTALLDGFGLHIPVYLTMDYLSAMRGHAEVVKLIDAGKILTEVPPYMREAYTAWMQAPQIAGLRFIADIPAFLITVFITTLVYIGIKESKQVNNVLVVLKLVVVLAVILLGAFFINPENWHPFAPNGFGGVMAGVSAVFFAYIGFDSLTTTAEECKDPQRDLPRAMMYSLLISTVLYVLIALVLTGMVHYRELGVDDPLAYVFSRVGLSPFMERLVVAFVAVSAVIAMTSALLVYQIGQPRIWMSMSRDGLLPPIFSRVHPRFRTPSFSTILTGVFVAVPSLFMNLTEVTDLTSIGTLFAFVLVCAGVLSLQGSEQQQRAKFRVPYVNAKYWLPLGLVTTLTLVGIFAPEQYTLLLTMAPPASENPAQWPLWRMLGAKLPMFLFLGISVWLCIQGWRKNYSLIPILGIVSCMYLMVQLSFHNWERFFIWLLFGLAIYYAYSYRNSKLNKA